MRKRVNKGLNAIIEEPNYKKIGRIHPNNYSMFIEVLKEMSKENEGLRKNITHIETLFDQLKTLQKRDFIKRRRTCIAIEKLIRGMDVQEVIEGEKEKWINIYGLLKHKKTFKFPLFIQLRLTKLYKRILKFDKEVMNSIVRKIDRGYTADEGSSNNKSKHKNKVLEFPPCVVNPNIVPIGINNNTDKVVGLPDSRVENGR